MICACTSFGYVCVSPGAFLHCRVTGACPVTTDLCELMLEQQQRMREYRPDLIPEDQVLWRYKATRKVIPPGGVRLAQPHPLTIPPPGHEKTASRRTRSSYGPPHLPCYPFGHWSLAVLLQSHMAWDDCGLTLTFSVLCFKHFRPFSVV